MNQPKYINIADIKTDPVPADVHAIAQPYIELFEACIAGKDQKSACQTLLSLPFEKRYIARVMRALQNAFCDFDTESVKVDLGCMSQSEIDDVIYQLKFRADQFQMLLKVFFE